MTRFKKCDHDASDPENVFYQRSETTRKPYKLCRPCRNARVAAKKNASEVAVKDLPIPMYLLEQPDLVDYPVWPAGVHLIPKKPERDRRSNTEKRDALECAKDLATVVALIARLYPDDRELIPMLTGTR